MIQYDAATIARYTTEGWWGETTIDALFRECVAALPQQRTLVDAPNRASFAYGSPRELTFAEIDVEVDQWAAWLYARGVRKDSIVLVQLPNIVEIVIAFLAISRLGAVISPMMLAYGERDVRRIVQHVQPTVFVTLTTYKGGRPADRARAIRKDLGLDALSILELGPDVATPAAEISAEDSSALRSYLATLKVSANDTLTMHWTSGTTGDPKCVPRSHNSWYITGWSCVDAARLQPGERILAPMQMVHTAGMSGVVTPWLQTRGLIALHQPFDMGVYLDQIETLGIHHTVAAPAMLNALLRNDTLDGRDVSSIRSILCGSAPLDSWMIEGFRKRYGIEIVNAFGSTEGMTLMSGPGITDDPHRRARYYPRFRGRDGRAWPIRIAPSVESKLVDIDTRAEILQPRVPGEFLFRSPALFPGYFTAEGTLDRRDFDADGYFRAGEIFEIAGEGEESDFYHYIDRLKDVINRGGVKIPVGELESAIQTHPAVAEAVAVGVRDEKLGERICAVVALRPGTTLTLDELIESLVSQGIAKYMLPERLAIVAALPRNPTGKVLKRDLAASVATV